MHYLNLEKLPNTGDVKEPICLKSGYFYDATDMERYYVEFGCKGTGDVNVTEIKLTQTLIK